MTGLLAALDRRGAGSGTQPPRGWSSTDPTYRWPVEAAAIPGDTTPYTMPGGPWNAPTPAAVPTYDGTSAAVHPSVVDFYDTPWHGWRFWMAFTPYQDERYENPSIVVSDDGYTWQVPDGLTNPIYPWGGVLGAYGSDTELVYDPDGDRLICYWRDVAAPDESNTRTVAKYSSDGTTWSDLVVVIPAAGHRDTLSPAVVRKGEGDWWLFGIKRPDTTLDYLGVSVYRSANPLTGWSAPEFVPLPNPTTPWHADIIWDGAVWRMLLSDSSVSRSIWAASSSDGLAWSNAVRVLASTAGWDNALYRPTMTVMDATRFRVWYSSVEHPTRRIGYTQLPRTLWPAP